MIRPALLRLAADMLAMAARKYACHVCNDFPWPEYVTVEDRASMLDAFRAGDPDTLAADLEQPYSPGDFVVMSALAKMLSEASDRGAS